MNDFHNIESDGLITVRSVTGANVPPLPPSVPVTRFIWTEANVRTLTYLWNDVGLSATEIGHRMGINKNMVVSKARRINLARRRDSKIIHKTQTRVLLDHARSQALLDLGPNDCRFPFSDPNKADFRFCGAPVKRGSSYCETHNALCWLPVPKKIRKVAA